MKFASSHFLWLLLVLPPALIAFLWWAGRTRERLLASFIQARLLPELTVGVSPARQKLGAVLLTGAAAFAIIALARPQWGFTWEESKQKGLDVVVAIDTSKSMLAEDIAPNRLARAKLAAFELLQHAKTDRLGLVAFAGGAFLQCPMTFDDAAFRQSVEMLDVNTLPQGGTAVAEAITTASAAFKEDDNYKVLVLFSDGEDQDSGAVEAARKAAESGLRIFTIGIGSADGEVLRVRDAKGRTEYVKDDAGNVVKSRLNEKLLQDIATAGGGFYLPLKGPKVIETLYEKGLAPLPKSESQAKLYQRYHEQFHWPLALAFLLLAVEFILPERRRPPLSKPAAPPLAAKTGPALLVLLGLLLPTLAEASTARALKDFNAGRYAESRAEYERLLAKDADDLRLAYNAGAAAYRAGQFAEAVKYFDRTVNAPDLNLQQRAYYNRGHAAFQIGDSSDEPKSKRERWEQSLKDFDSARKLDPKDADAQANYEFVKRKLEELKPQEQQQQNQDQDKDKQPDQQKDQPEKKDQSKPEDKKNESSPDQSPEKNDPKPGEDGKKDEPKDGKQPQPKDDPAKPDPTQPNQASKPKPGDGEQKPGEGSAQPMPVGQMTPEQAQRVLDMQKGDEQVLPVQLLAPKPSEDRKLKDW